VTANGEGAPVSWDGDDETEAQKTEVRRAGEGDAPEEFLWEGQVHRVRAVLTHESLDDTAGGAVTGAGRDEVWRVRASAGRHGHRGVYDLRFDWTAGRWTVTRITIEGDE
jgi:hypothetical protein